MQSRLIQDNLRKANKQKEVRLKFGQCFQLINNPNKKHLHSIMRGVLSGEMK